MEFEWDATKEVSNISKHGVSFANSIETFFDPNGFKLVDHNHSDKEPRFYWVGQTKKNRVLTTWFSERDSIIRIIGCAEWRKFRRLYYETTKSQ